MTIAGAPSKYQSVAYEAESSFGEDVAFSSPIRVETTVRVDTGGLTQEKIVPEAVYQRPNDGRPGFLGAIGGEVVVEKYLTGHGGSAVGALTATDLSTLLALALGSLHSANVGSDATGTPTATSIDTTAGVFADSSLARVGALGDGRAEGQWTLVNSETANTLTLGIALPAAPQAGDDVAAALMVYPKSDPCEAAQTVRLQIITPNGQFECYGCYAKSVTFTGLNAGEVPRVAITYGVAWWRTPAAPLTFPSILTTDEKPAVVVGGGSTFINTRGVSTRVTYPIRSLEVAINLEIIEKTGIGGGHPQQRVQGAVVAGNSMTVTATFDKPVAGTNTFDDLWLDDTADLHALFSLSVADGRSIAILLHSCTVIGNRPSQQELDQLNRVSLQFQSKLTSDAAASELVRADWILGMA